MELKEKIRNFFLKKRKKGILIGKGFALDDYKRENLIDIFQLDDSRKGHTFVFGTTRVGKTRLAENSIIQDIKDGKNVIVIDPKIDVDLFSSIFQAAAESSRDDDLMLLTTVYPELSIKINAIANYYLPDEVISTIMAGVPAEDPFFYNYAYEILSVVVRSIVMLRKHKGLDSKISIDELSRYISFGKMEELKTEIKSFKDEEMDKINNLLDSILEGEKEYFGKVSSTLRGTMTQLTTGNLAEVVGRAKNNEVVDRLESDKGVILVVQTGAMLQKQGALILGKVVVSMIQSVVGRYFAQGKKFSTPLCIYIDEMSNCTYYGIEDMFNKAGGCNCFITGLTQSPADIIAEIGADRARKLFDNTNTKIFMRMNDVDSASMLKTFGGTLNRQTTQLSLNGGIRSTEVEEDVLKETDFLELKEREFFYFGFEGKFKGKTTRTDDPYIKIIYPSMKNV